MLVKVKDGLLIDTEIIDYISYDPNDEDTNYQVCVSGQVVELSKDEYEKIHTDPGPVNTILTLTDGSTVEIIETELTQAIISDVYKDTLSNCVIGNSVTSIGDNAFYSCTSLTSIEIPNSVISIGDYAFQKCWSLPSITIEKHTTHIGYEAFSNCNSLISVKLNSNIISSKQYSSDYNIGSIFGTQVKKYIIGNNVKSIGEYAFYGCDNLKSIEISKSVTNIGQYAFYGCSGLTSVYISDIAAWCRITFFGSEANPLNEAYNFYLNKTLVTNLIIPNTVTHIGDYAFYRCTGLTSVTISNSVTRIGEHAFQLCSGLKTIEIPNSVTNIGDHAFGSCICLTSIVIPNSVTSIGNSVFSNCTSLTSIVIPNSVTNIGERAFQTCTDLSYIKIPNSVKSIGSYAFKGCQSLTRVNISDLNAWCNIDFSIPENPKEADDVSSNPLTIAQHLYLDNIEITETELVITNNVTNIKNYVFINCINFTSVNIGSSVTNIEEYAFKGCINLVSINVDNNNLYYSSQNGVLFNKDQTRLIKYPCKKESISYEVLSTVTSISSEAFEEYVNLEYIKCLITIPPTLGTNSLVNTKYFLIYVPDESYYNYISSDTTISKGWYEYRYRISKISDLNNQYEPIYPNNNEIYYRTKKQSKSSVSIRRNSESIVKENTYKEIGNIELDLTSLGGNITELAYGDSFDSTVTTSVILPDTVERISSGVSGTKITCITLGKNIQFFGTGALNEIYLVKFNGTKEEFDNTVLTQEQSKYYQSENKTLYTNIIICTDGIKYIDPIENNELWYCSKDVLNPKNNSMPDIVEDGNIQISNYRRKIKFVSNLETVGEMAFESKKELYSICLPRSITSIASRAFSCCSNLKSVFIPSSVKTIQSHAFAYAYNGQDGSRTVNCNSHYIFEKMYNDYIHDEGCILTAFSSAGSTSEEYSYECNVTILSSEFLTKNILKIFDTTNSTGITNKNSATYNVFTESKQIFNMLRNVEIEDAYKPYVIFNVFHLDETVWTQNIVIDNIVYKVPYNITWRDFLNSDNNTLGYTDIYIKNTYDGIIETPLTVNYDDFVFDGIYYSTCTDINKTISFYIDGKIYRSIDTFIWTQWLQSKYNTSNFIHIYTSNTYDSSYQQIPEVNYGSCPQENSYYYSSYRDITEPEKTILLLDNETTVEITETTLTKKLISDVYKNTLTECTIGKYVTTIDASTFIDCTNLQKIDISSSVTIIRGNVFSGCNNSNLKSILIPTNVNTIGELAFSNVKGTIILETLKSTYTSLLFMNSSTSDKTQTYKLKILNVESSENVTSLFQLGSSGAYKSGTPTYIVYTDNQDVCDKLNAYANELTIFYLYHLDGTKW